MFELKTKLTLSESKFGGDMVFIGIGNCSYELENQDSKSCALNFFNEHRDYALQTESFAWKYISSSLLADNSFQIVIERSKHFICGDPFEITQDTIRMLFVSYQTSPLYSTLNEIENLIVKYTHLIDYYIPPKSTCGEDAHCEGSAKKTVKTGGFLDH